MASVKKTIGNNRKIIYLAGFIFSVPLALTSYINSSFLEQYMDELYIGALYIVSALVTIFLMLDVELVLKRFGNRLVTLISGIAFFGSLLILALAKNATLAMLGFMAYFVFSNILITTLDIFIEDFSKSKAIGKLRGLYMAILSSAWVLSQMVSGSIIAKSSYSGIYLFSALFMILFSFIFLFFLKDFKDPVYKKVAIWKTFRMFWRNKNLSKIYLINLILKFFFAWMIIYTPIYLNEVMYLGWDKIGFIFSIMLIPFVILPYPQGKLSDEIGEKKMLQAGFITAGLAVLIIPFIETTSIIIWALVLFMTRVGASTIETMSESYFFKVVSEEQADEISFFRNTTPVSYILGPLVATVFLFFIPSFSYLFFILSAVLLAGLYITLRLKDIK